jgi:hypothetical protein
MILVDIHGHMIATESEEELHAFAKKIGLKRDWFQQPKKPLMRHAHYDLTTKTKIGQALDAGVKLRDTKELLKRAWWAEEEIPRGLRFWNLVARILERRKK